jgi:protein-tyrosine kinase
MSKLSAINTDLGAVQSKLARPDQPAVGGPPSLGQLLVRMGKLAPDRVEDVLRWQKAHDCNFGEAVTAMGLASSIDVVAALAEQYQYPIFNENATLQGVSRDLVVVQDPFSAAAERVRAIRSPLLTTWLGKEMHSLAVIGTKRGDGSTYFAANLALSLAQLGIATALVDANLRNPHVAEMFNLSSRSEGLSSVLRMPKLDALPILYDVLPALSVVLAGALPPNPQELLSGQRFVELVDMLERDFEAVIYDTPAGCETADAHIVSARVGSAIVVARRNRSTYKDVRTLTAHIRDAGCNVLGTVLNEH